MTCQALTARGLKPGDEMAVISCNNEQSLIKGLLPTLATIDVHPRQIGRLAVRQLTRRITGEFDGSAVTIEVKPTLLPGASLTPLRPDDDGGTRPVASSAAHRQGLV